MKNHVLHLNLVTERDKKKSAKLFAGNPTKSVLSKLHTLWNWNNIFLNQLLRFIIEDGDYCREDCEDCREVKNHSSEVSEKKTV